MRRLHSMVPCATMLRSPATMTVNTALESGLELGIRRPMLLRFPNNSIFPLPNAALHAGLLAVLLLVLTAVGIILGFASCGWVHGNENEDQHRTKHKVLRSICKPETS